MKKYILTILLILSVTTNAYCDYQMPEDLDAGKRREALKKIPKINEHVEKIINQGKDYIKDGRVGDAIKVFMVAKEIAPYDPRSYVYLSKIYISTNQQYKVLSLLEKAGKAYTDFNWIIDNINLENIKLESINQNQDDIYIAQFQDNKSGAISLNFDDGALSVYSKILPILDKYSFKATIPINPGLASANENPWWANWEQWKDASNRGYEISNHGMNHQNIVNLSDEAREYEVNDSYDHIKEMIGVAPSSFMFPFDASDESAINFVKQRHIAVRDKMHLFNLYKNTFIPIFGGSMFSVKTANELVNFALNNKVWIIAEYHAIKEENVPSFKPITEEFLDEHLKYLKEKEEDIWVDTFRNIYFYLYEHKNTNIQIEGQSDKDIVFSIKSDLDPEVFNVPLTIIIPKEVKKLKKLKAVDVDNQKTLLAKFENGKIYVKVKLDTKRVKVSFKL